MSTKEVIRKIPDPNTSSFLVITRRSQ